MTHAPVEIVIPPSSSFSLNNLADSPSRDRFLSTLNPLDPATLGREEVNHLMNTMKMAFVVFGQKVSNLENEMALREARFKEEVGQLRAELAVFKLEAEVRDARLQAELRETRLEAELRETKLQAEAEVRQVKLQAELTQLKYEGGNQFIGKDNRKVDVVDKPHVAVQALNNLQPSSQTFRTRTRLPEDFNERLTQAYNNGFKWRNSLVPVKNSKKLEKLVEWETSFQAGLDMTDEELLCVDYVVSCGVGAKAAALLRLQNALGIDLIKEHPNLNRYNLYQKAVKMALSGGNAQEHEPDSKYVQFVSKYWHDQSDKIKSSIVRLFAERGLSLKTFKLCTTQTVQPSPQVFPYDEGDQDGDDRWMAIRDGRYDGVIEEIVTSWV